jgi:hypothetical protein
VPAPTSGAHVTSRFVPVSTALFASSPPTRTRCPSSSRHLESTTCSIPYSIFKCSTNLVSKSTQLKGAAMPTSKPAVPAAAEPRFADRYDEWHSISTGHQRGESKLPIVTGWRQSRSTKLSHQFKNWDSGGTRCSDLAGEGSDSWNEKAKALIPTYDIESAQCSVGNILSGEGKGRMSQDPS